MIKNQNNNCIILQFTLFDVTGRYKPISTLVNVESIKYFKEHEEEVKRQAIQQICNQRRLSGKELTRLGYKRLKIRNYTLYLKTKGKKGKKENENETETE